MGWFMRSGWILKVTNPYTGVKHSPSFTTPGALERSLLYLTCMATGVKVSIVRVRLND